MLNMLIQQKNEQRPIFSYKKPKQLYSIANHALVLLEDMKIGVL